MEIERDDAEALRRLAHQETIIAAIHPGEHLAEDFLKPLGISQQKLSRETGIPMSRINGIVRGTRGLTADTALRLGRFFGMSPKFRLGLQADYDIETARGVLGDRLEREVRPLPDAG